MHHTPRKQARQTDKQTDGQTDRQTNRQTDRQTEKRTDGRTDRPTRRQRDRQTETGPGRRREGQRAEGRGRGQRTQVERTTFSHLFTTAPKVPGPVPVLAASCSLRVWRGRRLLAGAYSSVVPQWVEALTAAATAASAGAERQGKAQPSKQQDPELRAGE